MLRKLSAALVMLLATAAAPGARADEAPAADDAAASEAKAAEPEASKEPADEAEPEADEEADALAYDRDGWYVGAGGGGAIEFFQHGSADDSGFAQIRAGYHFLQFAALELQLEYTPKFKGRSGNYAGVNTTTFGTWANIKGYPTAPWTGPVQPFAMIGLGWWWERRSGSALDGVRQNGGFVSRFGGGVDFYVTRNIVVTAETAYVVPTGHVSSLDQLQIGGALQYRFDP
jgi:hypothetical protein